MHNNKRTLAIDYGERRVGLALSDELGIIASGIGTVNNDPLLLSRLLTLLAERGVARIVIGLPLTLKGADGDIARVVRAFAEQLRGAANLPVQLIDERFTSSLAQQAIRDMGVGKKKRRDKGKIDEIAAVILLQGFLDSEHNTAG
ncbi:MAG: Holliday junction resolvase RuvX [Bacteroidetes bacterium]|nr:Holliday junction resolvase RuvX [Bacteroidota bacterium]